MNFKRFQHHKHLILGTVLGLFILLAGSTGYSRQIVDLGKGNWTLWLDEQAEWQHDKLYHPVPENMADLPYNAPSGGWEALENQSSAITVHVPGTVEEYVHELGRDKYDYVGVSWWTTQFKVPEFTGKKRIVLKIDSVRLRSEVFIDEKLVSYSLLDGVPLEMDVTEYVKSGQIHTLAVRITDPGGNFTWHDFPRFRWGDYGITLSHGFGGVTGPVSLEVTNQSWINDIYMQNTLNPRTVKLNVELKEQGKKVTNLRYVIVNKKNPKKLLHKGRIPVRDAFAPITSTIHYPGAKLWNIDTPELYICKVKAYAGKELIDSSEQTFGFRSFNVVGVGENAHFMFNGKRLVVRSTISWGFWPENGMWPTGELGPREISAAKGIGLNMINYHRCIGRPENFAYANELGLMTYEEPGGLISVDNSPFGWELQRDRILSMVRRDRSHPSLLIFSLMNEYKENLSVPATERDAFNSFCKNMIQQMHQLAPDTMITLTSGWDTFGSHARTKLHMRPYDNEPHCFGYVDFHRAGGPATFHEGMYQNPTNHTGYVSEIDELYFRGEEGAVPSAPLWPAIVNEINPKHPGWDAQVQYDRLKLAEDFFTAKGLDQYFPSLNELLRRIGSVSYEHQGQRILMHRICDSTDGYVVNGWEKTILENFSGVVDSHRNHVGDPELILRHNRPLVLAVLVRKQVLHTGDKTKVDLHIVNEVNVQGAHTIDLTVAGPDGAKIHTESFSANIEGGKKFAQLLKEAIELPLSDQPGMNRITARLLDKDGKEIVSGYDDVMTVNYRDIELAGKGAVYGTKNDAALEFLTTRGADVVEYDGSQTNLDWLIVSRSPKPIPSAVATEHIGSGAMDVTFFSGMDYKAVARKGKTTDLTMKVASGMPPDEALGANAPYSVRWEGTLLPPVSGNYGFAVESLEFRPALKLWLNGKLVHEKYSINTIKNLKAEAGKPIQFKLEYANNDGSGDMAFKWLIPGETALEPVSVLNVAENQGARVIIIDKAEEWVDYFSKVSDVQCEKKMPVWTVWKGGIFFVREHPFFEGLPVNCSLDWPYQALVERNGRERYALKMTGEELIAGAWQSIRHFDFGTSVGCIPQGEGEIVFNTLHIKSNLLNPAGPAHVARLLFSNFINAK